MFDALRAVRGGRRCWLFASATASILSFAGFALAEGFANSALVSEATSSSASAAVQTNVAQSRTPSNKYPILDSHVRVDTDPSSDRQVFWVNNESVIFIAAPISPAAPPSDRETVTYSIRLWNFSSGKITTIRDFGRNRVSLCYDEGVVLYYSRHADGTYEAYQGKLGSERPVHMLDGYSLQSCRPLAELPSTPSWAKGHEIRRLQKLGAGFLDFGPHRSAMSNSPIRLYKPGAKEVDGLTLPFGRRDVERRFPYFRFADAFFVESSSSIYPHPEDMPYPVYWLYETGQIQKIADIPWGPWRARGGFLVAPVRPGLLMVSYNARSPSEIDHAGIYLLRDNHVEKVVAGWVLGMKVSPDGCRLALNFAPFMSLKDGTLRILQLCEVQ